MQALTEAFAAIGAFMDQGGPVMYAIAALTFVMWALVFERVWYFRGGLKGDVQQALSSWEKRPERKSWNAHQIRAAMVSRMSAKINQNMDMITTLIALCPLMGLLGTVTGMIEVFSVLSLTGGGDAKQMAGGVSRATIPTMSGMVAAISGLFANTYLTRVAEREDRLFADHLTMDH
ncbi:MotA/TolQ/ExbB proton channel family protein [Cellvibrio japonicus]|uniref:TonB system transport protein ExbB2 n=1 Tax=Cellvibrio japonicus (strain Ueda107) TaxID=498211 RepID=B3PIW2_CELJU|nr:MotA/TolQ/ExbB proton channel family protein [Cellvibrio japonicus]ACE85141.1 TonB system transport protein ExbB2 [Cellvibrio japonicus Ueda107]QEI11171.1 MotA/TolQ/ExbB proton channel family protein [Cellvibrio japonicus]QEI14745.1 MotA/TolQ/ExbB proton channel family protein [Cellvibrio japonicus]QEI18325.1 MotA/TolQ/ExbB proton channel family protein [Cellvibrio japonicus]